MIKKYLDVLVKQLDDKISQIQDALGDGSAKDYEEYRAMCGEIKGLLTARLNVKDLQSRIEEHDND